MKKKRFRKTVKKTDPGHEEFYGYVRDIVHHPAVLRMKEYPHHCDTSCYQHCLNVAYMNYRLCKFFHLDARSAARAGMLHDLFLYDWHTHTKETGDHFHAMTHPKTALKNAKQYFDLNELEEEMILKHMWPVTLALPTHKETFVICMTDKYCGSCEITHHYAKLPAVRKPYLLFRRLLKRVFGADYQYENYQLPHEASFAQLLRRPSLSWKHAGRPSRRKFSSK